MFDLNLKVGSYKDCHFDKSGSGKDTRYMIVNANDTGPVCIINVLHPCVPEGCIAVKDYSENAGVESELKRLGVIPEGYVSSFMTGYATCNVYEFDEEKAMSL